MNPQSVVENNLTKGLITYATGLNFPENAVVASSNMVYEPYGLAHRRMPLDTEAGGNTSVLSGAPIVGYFWKDGTADGSFYFYILQTNNLLNIFKVDPTLTTVSTDFFEQIDLNLYATFAIATWTECQFSSGNGYLFVVNQTMTPIALFYDASSGLLDVIESPIMVRDFDGEPEAGAFTNTRPGALTSNHNYNLINQGWTDGTHGDDTTTNKISTFLTDIGKYPSNADIWWEFKDTSSVYNPTTSVVNSIALGNSPAPQGHFILDAFAQSHDTAFGAVVGLQDTTADFFRPSAVAFFAGRVFYSGTPWNGFSQNIYFSQIITSLGTNVPTQMGNNGNYNTFGACFQQNDPTSEQNFDLLPIDGGVVRIPEAGIIYKLWPLQGALIVFASNGIWSLTGTQSGLGFTADNYSVNKISSVRTISYTSFVDVMGYPMFWTHEGIYSLTVDTTANVSSGGFVVKSLTDQTILQFFQAIPGLSKLYARGTYDPFQYQVKWIYSSTAPGSEDALNSYDSVLTFNTLTGSFSPWSVPTDNNVLREIFTTISTNPSVNSYRTKYVYSFIVASQLFFGFADETPNASVYQDWITTATGPEDYVSSFDTAYKIFGQADKRVTENWLTIYFSNQALDQADPSNPTTIVSSAQVRNKWDYSLNLIPVKWDSQQLCQVIDNSYSTAIRRLRMRGRGRVFQLNFTSDGSYPMNVEGWSMSQTVNPRP